MDGFTYHNIFDTKGVEYLIVIAFLVLLIPFWIILNKQEKVKRAVQQAWGILSAGILNIPLGVYYSKNHTWTHLNKSGSARIGLDDLLVHITGRMQFRNMKNEGEAVVKGEVIAEFEQEGKKLQIYSPLSGTILHVNQDLQDDAGLLNEDPYGRGFLFQIMPSDWKAETSSYYVSGESADWLKNELLRFKDFLATSVTRRSPSDARLILQDGGELRDETLSALPQDIWNDFQKEFLNPE